MEFTQIFTTFLIILIGILGITGFINYENSMYNTNVGNTFQSTLSSSAVILNKTMTIGTNVGNTTTGFSGAGTGTSSGDMAIKALGTIGLLPQLISLPGTLISGATTILHIDPIYGYMTFAFFTFGFAVLLAYLILVGVRRIL